MQSPGLTEAQRSVEIVWTKTSKENPVGDLSIIAINHEHLNAIENYPRFGEAIDQAISRGAHNRKGPPAYIRVDKTVVGSVLLAEIHSSDNKVIDFIAPSGTVGYPTSIAIIYHDALMAIVSDPEFARNFVTAIRDHRFVPVMESYVGAHYGCGHYPASAVLILTMRAGQSTQIDISGNTAAVVPG